VPEVSSLGLDGGRSRFVASAGGTCLRHRPAIPPVLSSFAFGIIVMYISIFLHTFMYRDINKN
jgi:hypothetical protein